MRPPWRIRALSPSDPDWVRKFIIEHWGAEEVVAHGDVAQPAQLPGFACILHNEIIGLVTYRILKSECEIISLDSLKPQNGIWTALIEAITHIAVEKNCTKLWLVTTNDNLLALGFYQRRGFKIAAVYPDAVTEARKIKPSIPLVGLEGIPLTDEIVLEKKLPDR